jgi:hypothetical protein
MKRTPWQRLTLSLFGILIVLAVWRWSVGHLYTLPEAALSSFTAITTNAMYVISAIVIFMVTGRLVYEWSNRTESIQNTVSQVEHSKEEIIEVIRAPKASHFDDGGEGLDP